MEILKAPFPYFGGKSQVSHLVWERLGDCPVYIEPFFGSGANLLGRPRVPNREFVNDIDGYVANFWRALQRDPESVAKHACNPVFENDLHARHSWLVRERADMGTKLEGDPDWFDAKAAGWWAWGISCWIGHGFCSGKGPWHVNEIDGIAQLTRDGPGVSSVSRKRPAVKRMGVQRNLPVTHTQGVNRQEYVNNGLGEYLNLLADRLQDVTVCCGDWKRICGTSHLFHEGTPTGIFLDPPYSAEAGRDNDLYRMESADVAHEVREWALKYGDDKRLRICLCGYEGEHEMPDTWDAIPWKAQGGMGNQGDGDNENRNREMLWFSPHCINPDAMPLFRGLD